MVPYRNKAALAAYYLGLFSIIPCLGPLLSIAAIVFGIMGLRQARLRPEAKGKVHAWVGIIAGLLFGLVALAITLALGAGLIAAASHR
jgi:thiol:disulfide interchange protein